MNCRHCNKTLEHVFIDLGHQPPSNAYLSNQQINQPEITFPLKAYVCDECWLVQLPAHAGAGELFTEDYAYFSSTSTSWVEHARVYVDNMVARFDLDGDSFVVELASNDGYLLQFVKDQNIPCLGIEPTHSTAEASRALGIETLEEFFGQDMAMKTAKKYGHADLMAGNNVLAHVPDINDFVAGIYEMLAPEGVATLEFPHLLRLVEGVQFDTVYHEHYSYLSLHSVMRIFKQAGLRIFDVEELPTHGGSIRIFAARNNAQTRENSPRVEAMVNAEKQAGMDGIAFYSDLQKRAENIKNDLLAFLLEQKKIGKSVAAYGAAAKGNTLLNFAGVKPDLLPFVCDAAPSKQGQYMPASHIPILTPEELNIQKPDYVLILPWNIKTEVMKTQSHIKEWGGKFVVAVPDLKVL